MSDVIPYLAIEELEAKQRQGRSPSKGVIRPVSDSPALQRVKAAGIDLFFELGFLATTIRAITGACDLTPPAFYNHFESKEALLYTIISDANSVLEQELDRLAVDLDEPATSLKSLVNTLVAFNLKSPKEARVANREYGFLHSPVRDEVIEHRRRVRSLFEVVLDVPGLPRGLIQGPGAAAPQSTETRLLAISIINLCIASSDWFRSEGPLSEEAVADACCRLALRMAMLDDPLTLVENS
jgi:AcrR family transcriptional regulator